MKAHPAADLFPLMDADDLRTLADDIAANGLLHPIVIFNGDILDGRNRLKACDLAGVKPRFVEWLPVGDITPSTWIIATNLKRRHLTKSQCAAIAVELLPMLEKEAAKRRAQAEGQPRGRKQASVPEKMPEESGSRDQAGEMLGVSGRYVSDAKKLKAEAPELFEQVKVGTTTLAKARRAVTRRQKQEELEEWKLEAKRSPTADTRPPSIVLADPPWQYDFSATDARKIENQYPSATVEEIVSHRPEVADDAVLYLWATAPKLQEALAVMAGWGFAYVTSAVWDKEIMGMGYWFRGQHELLLVGKKGGARPPPENARVSSVFRERRIGHSQKPRCVYLWIEEAFPMAAKMEMYQRTPREGWQQGHGNEVK